MNLIKDPWIPVRRADGTICTMAPWEIGSAENPVIEIVAPRPDFRGALYQFLIGLVQTTFAPEDDDEWEESWYKTPHCDELRLVFENLAEAFELINHNGPAFMQDYNLPEKAEESNIRTLLIDAPGDNTIKKNLDHFVKRDSINGLCNNCLAAALFTLQINAPSGGSGHRTGLRGGGPLTTLVLLDEINSTVWKSIWLNVLSIDKYRQFANQPGNITPGIFPWMGPTRESSNKELTNPEDVNELQLYWGMPRRIRIAEKNKRGECSICGNEAILWNSYRVLNYGANYSSTWRHSLTPYRRKVEKDKIISLITIKGKQGGFTYPDWLSLTFGNDKNELVAHVVNSFNGQKIHKLTGMNHARLWCFGYDMDNMKARCWYDQTMPLILLPDEKRLDFKNEVVKIVAAAEYCSRLLRDKIKTAWFSRPKDAKGDISFILTSFWEETETSFYRLLEKLRTAIVADESTDPILIEWRQIIINTAEKLFDRFALQDTDDVKNMKRIADAARALTNILNSPKTKIIQVLKEGI